MGFTNRESWIRTNEDARSTDLQSIAFDRSAISLIIIFLYFFTLVFLRLRFFNQYTQNLFM